MSIRRMHAITRELSPAISRCELTHLARAPIDYARAVAQHQAYVALLQSLGLGVTRLAAEPELPDAVFVEDTAIVLDELAIMMQPGAASRRPELVSVEAALRPWRQLARIVPPGTLDGGDVLALGRTLYVGLSSRSNRDGATQLREHVAPWGYSVETVSVSACLHLKSAVSVVHDELLLLNPAWCERTAFAEVASIEVDPAEPSGANLIRLADSVIIDAAYPLTAARLRAHGAVVHCIDMSELAKAEGAVTCCSLIFAP